MTDAADILRRIVARLQAGEVSEVCVVDFEGAGPRVTWGFDNGQALTFTFAGARKLAATFDAKGYLPDVAELLRQAADVCEAQFVGRQ